MSDHGAAELDARAGRARRLAAPLGVLAATVGAAGFLAWNGPHVPGVSCPSRALTGMDCPGCGTTRSMAAFVRGDLAGALDQNLLAVVALPLLAWAWAGWLVEAWTGRRIATPLDRPGAALATLVVVVGFTVVRNVDVGLGTFLASGLG